MSVQSIRNFACGCIPEYHHYCRDAAQHVELAHDAAIGQSILGQSELQTRYLERKERAATHWLAHHYQEQSERNCYEDKPLPGDEEEA